MGLVKTCRGSSYALPHTVNYWNRKMSISSTGRHQLLTPTERDVPSTIKQEGEVKSLSRVRLFATSWRVAYQAPPSVGFSRQEYWSGLPFPSPGDLPDLGLPHCRQILHHFRGRKSSPKWLLPVLLSPDGALVASCPSGRLSNINR